MPKISDTSLPWAEAEEAFLTRLGMSSEEFYALAEAYRGRAWTLTHIADHQMMLRIKEQLQASIESGGTLQEFRKWLAQDVKPGMDAATALEWTGAYTQTVFRMATFTSYSSGRWKQITDPDVVEEFGYLMYDAVNDDRTRDDHAEMDGKVWRREEFPDYWWPPNGFNCRCEVRAVNEEIASRLGGEAERDQPTVLPDDGFQTNQAANQWATDLGLESHLRGVRSQLNS